MTLTKIQESAAQLVADDKLTDEEIANRCKITRQTLHNWKKDLEFAARVEEHRSAWRAAVMSTGIAIKENRIASLNERHRRLSLVIDARGKRYSDEIDSAPLDALIVDSKDDAPRIPPEEARTGIVIESVTYLKEGKRVEWAVDTPMLAEMRNIEKQAAQELGQWVEKQDVEVRDSAAKQSLKRRLLPKPKPAGD